MCFELFSPLPLLCFSDKENNFNLKKLVQFLAEIKIWYGVQVNNFSTFSEKFSKHPIWISIM